MRRAVNPLETISRRSIVFQKKRKPITEFDAKHLKRGGFQGNTYAGAWIARFQGEHFRSRTSVYFSFNACRRGSRPASALRRLSFVIGTNSISIIVRQSASAPP
jgi:hypothetical protein